MNDFDANLIREFRTRPAFYDRNNPRFKDKVFTAREWQEISNKLGYDVSLLKDRMLQLRNRYNLEKRRIETLREENPNILVESPWPLFDHLHFLSQHIRARRSYKRMLTAAPRMELQSNNSNSSSGGGVDGGGDDGDEIGVDQMNVDQMNVHTGEGFPNGFLPVRVKMEQYDENDMNSNGSEVNGLNGNMLSGEIQGYIQNRPQQHQEQQETIQQNDTDADESYDESQSATDRGAFLAAQSATMLSNKQYASVSQQQQHQQQQQHHQQVHPQQPQQQQQQRLHPSAPPPLRIRRIDTLRGSGINTWVPVPSQQQQKQQTQEQKRHKRRHNSHSTNNSIHNAASSSSQFNLLRAAKMKSSVLTTTSTNVTPREQKYAAFGDFVASSLLDLPAVTAMKLIEKFTTEVVKVLIETDETATKRTERNPSTGKTTNCNGVSTANAVN